MKAYKKKTVAFMLVVCLGLGCGMGTSYALFGHHKWVFRGGNVIDIGEILKNIAIGGKLEEWLGKHKQKTVWDEQMKTPITKTINATKAKITAGELGKSPAKGLYSETQDMKKLEKTLGDVESGFDPTSVPADKQARYYGEEATKILSCQKEIEKRTEEVSNKIRELVNRAVNSKSELEVKQIQTLIDGYKAQLFQLNTEAKANRNQLYVLNHRKEEAEYHRARVDNKTAMMQIGDAKDLDKKDYKEYMKTYVSPKIYHFSD